MGCVEALLLGLEMIIMEMTVPLCGLFNMLPHSDKAFKTDAYSTVQSSPLHLGLLWYLKALIKAHCPLLLLKDFSS